MELTDQGLYQLAIGIEQIAGGQLAGAGEGQSGSGLAVGLHDGHLDIVTAGQLGQLGRTHAVEAKRQHLHSALALQGIEQGHLPQAGGAPLGKIVDQQWLARELLQADCIPLVIGQLGLRGTGAQQSGQRHGMDSIHCLSLRPVIRQ